MSQDSIDLEDQLEHSEAESKLLTVLSELSDSVAFCAAGEVDTVLPGLQVDGVGDVGVPVSVSDAKRIIKAADQAPYGRGDETIVDTTVRKVWQLEAGQFRFENKQWASLVDEVVKKVRSEFGSRRKINEEIYKLLVYEKGGFFLPHRDTEKAEGMFATLIICLPSKHTGGKLLVNHNGQCRQIDFSKESKFATQFAAFYADCEHEVKPVKSGYRICVVYNLSIPQAKSQPLAPVFGSPIESAANSLAQIFNEDEDRGMLVLPLAHQYTEAGLTEDPTGDREVPDTDEDDWEEDDDEPDAELASDDWEPGSQPDEMFDEADKAAATLKQVRALLKESKKATSKSISKRHHKPGFDRTASQFRSKKQSLQMKGADRARVEVLKLAAVESNCRAHIVLLTHWQSGYPDYGTIEYGYGYDSYDCDVSDNSDAEFEEVFDETIKLTHWHDLSGTPQSIKELYIDESDILFDGRDVDRACRLELHEATGNAGVSMERWYHQAVVAVWPESWHFKVLATQGPKNAVPELASMLDEVADKDNLEDCRKFARAILVNWVASDRYTGRFTTSFNRDSTLSELPVNIFMRSLIEIGDSRLAFDFFKLVAPMDYCGLESDSVVQLANLADWKKLKPVLAKFFKSQKPNDYSTNLTGLVRLFYSLCCGDRESKLSAMRKATCKSLVGEVELAINRWDKTRTQSWQTVINDRSGVVESMLRALCVIGAKDATKTFLAKICSDKKHYDLHEALIPPAVSLMIDKTFSGSSGSKLSQSTAKQLHQHCVDILNSLTESEPQPPADWKRSAKLGCNCDDCKELARFLRSKTERVLRLPRNKDDRKHLHRQIDNNRIDCGHTTERIGRPFTLVCTKTQASYDRELSQYKTNLKLLAELIA